MWQPRGNTVFVRKAAAKDVTEGGIVLPNAEATLFFEGEVVAASSEWNHLEGKRVLFSKFSGSEVKVGSEALLIMQGDDVLAFWQDGE